MVQGRIITRVLGMGMRGDKLPRPGKAAGEGCGWEFWKVARASKEVRVVPLIRLVSTEVVSGLLEAVAIREK